MTSQVVINLFIVFSILLPLVTAQDLIDDFTLPKLNNMGGVRSGVHSMFTYLRRSVTISTPSTYLYETLAPAKKPRNIFGKALIIKYTAFESGERTIKLMETRDKDFHLNVYKLKVPVHKGEHSITVLLSRIAYADLTKVHGLGIEGPLFVHRLELVDDKLSNLDGTLDTSLVFAKPSSEPPIQFYQYRSALNLNKLNLRRSGAGITKLRDGIKISGSGFLFETIVARNKNVDLRNKELRITYSSTKTTTMNLRLEYPLSAAHGHSSLSFITLRVPASKQNILSTPFTDFPNLRAMDGKGIWIHGSLIIHRIELYNRSRPTKYKLIDNLSNWPNAAVEPSLVVGGIHNLPVFSQSPESSIYKKVMGLNYLGYPCGGDGIFKAKYDIRLSNNGYIFEQVAPRNGSIDVTNAFLEIYYSAEQKTMRQLEIIRVIPNDDDPNYHTESEIIDLHLEGTKQDTARISLTQFGLIQAFRIIGSGEVSLCSFQLQIPNGDDEDIYDTKFVDIFNDWPFVKRIARDDSPSYKDSDIIGSKSPREAQLDATEPDFNIFDYRKPMQPYAPAFHQCSTIIGHGIEINHNGYLSQSIATGGLACYLNLQYSASYTATREIFLVSQSNGQFWESSIHVMFNCGQQSNVVIPLPASSTFIIAIRINGPLIVHQLEVLDPIQSASDVMGSYSADALLIDNFSDWSKFNTNMLNQNRDAQGITGPGFITLDRNDHYLIEYFKEYTQDENIENLALRISYTVAHHSICKMSLIEEQKDMLKIPPLLFRDIVFPSGTNTQVVILLADLRKSNEGRPTPYLGMAVHGPLKNNNVHQDPLTIHKVELVSPVPFAHPIIRTGVHSFSGRTGDYVQEFSKQQMILRNRDGPLNLRVGRNSIWKDASCILEWDSSKLRRNRIYVRFTDDEPQVSTDIKDLLRQFFTLVSAAFSDPKTGLFSVLPDTDNALQINPDSGNLMDKHLNHYKLVGRIIGMALMNNNVLPINLVPGLYRSMVTGIIGAHDGLPEQIAKGNSEISFSDRNIGDVSSPSVPGFVPDTLRHAQTNALCEGVWDVIPQPVLSLFSESELELLIGGQTKINIGDWMVHARYLKGFWKYHLSVEMFWRCVHEWDNDKRARLLQFVTGSPRLPCSGFSKLRLGFAIGPAPETDVRPTASVDIGPSLLLPQYSTLELMCQQLELVI